MLIAVTGFMGAGKSEVSRELSKLLSLELLDTDSLAESREKRSISEIFAQSGEAYFRRLESEVLIECIMHKSGIICCGGGIVLLEENRELLRQRCTTILLKAPLDIVFTRIAGNKTRPLAYNKSREELETLAKGREPLYRECADLTVERENDTPFETAEKIAILLAKGICK